MKTNRCLTISHIYTAIYGLGTALSNYSCLALQRTYSIALAAILESINRYGPTPMLGECRVVDRILVKGSLEVILSSGTTFSLPKIKAKKETELRIYSVLAGPARFTGLS